MTGFPSRPEHGSKVIQEDHGTPDAVPSSR